MIDENGRQHAAKRVRLSQRGLKERESKGRRMVLLNYFIFILIS